MIYNHIPVKIGCLPKVTAAPINFQYDQVQVLQIEGIELPTSYRVDFCNPGDAATITMVGTEDGVQIPNQLLATGLPVIAYVVLTGTDENAVETRYQITIPVNKRPPASDIQPTPAEQSTIDSLIDAMNTAVEDAETAEQGAKDAQQAIEDMTVSAETLAPGSAATVTKTIIENVVHLLFGIPRGQQGAKGDPGEKGDTGNGITSITLISAVGLDKTYRIAYTNGDHFDYVVKDGAKGDTGNGIARIAKTGTSGKVDTYTITYTNGNTTTFTVTNGTDGEDGISPAVTITTITGGHRVTITDEDHPSGQSFDVMDGQNTDAEHVTYDATQTYSSDTVGNALNQLNSDITDLNANKAPIITDTASGAIASFPDGADGLPIKQLTVAVNPVQDLHGYDHPWPAGGNVNLLDPNEMTIQGTIQVQFYKANNFTFKANTTYSLRYYGTNNVTLYFAKPVSGVYATGTGKGLSFTPEEDCQGFLQFTNTNGIETDITKFSLSIGSSAPASWSPYSNECPISGWTGANVTDDPLYAGEIMWSQLASDNKSDWEKSAVTLTESDGVFTLSSAYDTATAKTARAINGLIPNHKYLIQADLKAGTSQIAMGLYNGSNHAGRVGTGYQSVTSFTRFGIVADAVLAADYLAIRVPNDTPTGNSASFKNPMAFDLTAMFGAGNEPATFDEFRALFPNEYYAYTPTPVKTNVSAVSNLPYNTLPITFPDSAGTVYGAELTVNEDGTGKLVVDHLNVDLGALSWTKINNSRGAFFANYRLSRVANNNYISSMYYLKGNPYGDSSDLIVHLYNGGNNGYILIRNLAYSDAESFQTAMDGVQLVYELETPVEYSLTAEQVGGILTTLKGENNVWADTGDVSLEYRADTKLYLEKLTAPTEDDLVADHPIASGQFFMIGNSLYLATAAIAAEANINPGTNATKLSLADALNLINS